MESLGINPEETMHQITAKIQDKGGIRPCNVILTKIDTGCHCGNFSLQKFLLEDISEVIDICLLFTDQADINEAKVESTEIVKPVLPNTNFHNKKYIESHIKISYKKYIEVLQEQLDYLKSGITENNKIICNLISAMTRNASTPLRGSKSPWLPSAKANELVDRSTSTPPLCLDVNTPKLNSLNNPLYNEENYINLLHRDELLSLNIENIKIKEQLK